MSLIRVAKIYKDSTKVYEDVEQPEDKHCWWECKVIQPLWKIGHSLES